MEMKLPPHDAALHLSHNRHKSYYKTVKDAIDYGTYDEHDFVNLEQLKLAIATDECWELTWYPKTPVTSYRMLAANLEVLLNFANEV